jgi:hypothetical protein
MSDETYEFDDGASFFEGGKAPAKKRTFTVESSSTGLKGGRYKGTQPLGAARKAARAIMVAGKTKSCSFVLRESTQGSAKKEFAYRGSYVKLKTPKTRTLPNGTTLTQTDAVEVKANK